MTSTRLAFHDFELDIRAGRLRRGGQLVRLQPQPFRVLAILAEQAGHVVSREDLRRQVWDAATFVEFDQGLNYCIRQIRLALNDDAGEPVYLETVKRQGYRFIAPVTVIEDVPPAAEAERVPASADGADRRPSRPAAIRLAAVVAGLLVLATAGGGWLYHRPAARSAGAPPALSLQPVTDFADSALAPALSPNGRMVAFIRGNNDFLTPDQVYVKMLPGGEARQLTHDPRLKYGPVFSPDGSEVAYSVMEHSGWATYAVSVLGGEPHLVLSNAAGLTWLDAHRLLYSAIQQGQHMGIVTSDNVRADARELYLPAHDRGMAHYSFASPDRHAALVVEMDEKPVWMPCRLIALEGQFPSRQVGPRAPCTSAGWSPDGRWMYFGASGHLWRQAFPDGAPEQLTFGPTDEQGVAVDPDGRSMITSVGGGASTLWIHDATGDRRLSSEGQVVASEGAMSAPVFSRDGHDVYYLLRRADRGTTQELHRLSVRTGHSEALVRGVFVLEYDVSPDGSRIVYTTPTRGGSTELWIAPADRRTPAVSIARDVTSPYFGPDNQILYRWAEGGSSYLGRMNADGSGRTKVVPYPISTIQGVSPGRNWVMAIAPLLDRSTVAPMAIPVRGGDPVRVCEIFCEMSWTTTGEYLLASVEERSLASPGRTLAIPAGPGETLPPLPPQGIPPLADARLIRGARTVAGGYVFPGADPETFVYLRFDQHRNLFRLVLPPED